MVQAFVTGTLRSITNPNRTHATPYATFHIAHFVGNGKSTRLPIAFSPSAQSCSSVSLLVGGAIHVSQCLNPVTCSHLSHTTAPTSSTTMPIKPSKRVNTDVRNTMPPTTTNPMAAAARIFQSNAGGWSRLQTNNNTAETTRKPANFTIRLCA